MKYDPLELFYSIEKPERRLRPKEFKVAKKVEICPFCPGNEHLTPPETFRIGDPWELRVIPNKYPILPNHEVVIETRDHKDWDSFPLKELENVLIAYKERTKHFYENNFNYVYIFRNYGPLSGASIEHPHSQILPFKEVPFKPLHEEKYFLEKGYPLNNILLDFDKIKVYEPEVKQTPCELRIFTEFKDFTELKEEDIKLLAMALKESIKIIKEKGANSYNIVFHQGYRNCKKYYLHIRILPRFEIFGPVEMDLGIWIS